MTWTAQRSLRHSAIFSRGRRARTRAVPVHVNKNNCSFRIGKNMPLWLYVQRKSAAFKQLFCIFCCETHWDSAAMKPTETLAKVVSAELLLPLTPLLSTASREPHCHGAPTRLIHSPGVISVSSTPHCLRFVTDSVYSNPKPHNNYGTCCSITGNYKRTDLMMSLQLYYRFSNVPLSSPTAASVDRAKESRERAMSSRPWKCWAMWSLHTEHMLWIAFAAADARGFSLRPFIR